MIVSFIIRFGEKNVNEDAGEGNVRKSVLFTIYGFVIFL